MGYKNFCRLYRSRENLVMLDASKTVKVEVSEYPNAAFPPFSKWGKRETGENRLLHRARDDVPFGSPIGVAKSCTAETRTAPSYHDGLRR